MCMWTKSVCNKTHVTWVQCVCVDKQGVQQDTPNVVQGVCVDKQREQQDTPTVGTGCVWVWTNSVSNKTHLPWVQGVCGCGQTA